MPIQRLKSDEALLQELGQRIARLRLERNLSQAQLAEQAGISKRTLERLEAGASATQLSLFLRVLRQLDLLERLELLLPEPQLSPLALLQQRRRASAPADAALPNRPEPGAGGGHDRGGRRTLGHTHRCRGRQRAQWCRLL